MTISAPVRRVQFVFDEEDGVRAELLTCGHVVRLVVEETIDGMPKTVTKKAAGRRRCQPCRIGAPARFSPR